MLVAGLCLTGLAPKRMCHDAWWLQGLGASLLWHGTCALGACVSKSLQIQADHCRSNGQCFEQILADFG